MALLTCPDCHGKVSDSAPACPHCGRPATAKEEPLRCPDCGSHLQEPGISCQRCGWNAAHTGRTAESRAATGLGALRGAASGTPGESGSDSSRNPRGSPASRVFAATLGGTVALAVLAGLSATAGPDGPFVFFVAAAGVTTALVLFSALLVRRGVTWRWYHTMSLAIVGASVALVGTVSITVPGDAEVIGFALGLGLSIGGLLGIAATLLVYGFRGAPSNGPRYGHTPKGTRTTLTP